MLRVFPLLLALVLTSGCLHITMDPVQVHAIVEVNVKVDKALDDFFGDLDEKSATVESPANE